MTDPFQAFGVSRVLNAAGTLTRLGGANVAPEVAAAIATAAQSSVDIVALQAAASRRIAAATGAEAGLVTTGASAALTLAAAAAIAGLDPARMERLPDTRGLANEILMPRTHRTGYDRALRTAINDHWVAMFPDAATRPVRQTVEAPLDQGKLLQCDFVAILE